MQMLLMTGCKSLVFMTTPQENEALRGAGGAFGEALYRTFNSLWGGGWDLGDTSDSRGSRIMTMGWLFFVLVRIRARDVTSGCVMSSDARV
jgi:hypothetical protein